MDAFLNQFWRAARLDAEFYKAVADDAGSLNPAMVVVLIYAAAAAFGSFGRAGATGINIGLITTVIGWYVWAFMAYITGARLLPEPATRPDRKTVMRAMGFACAPGVARLLGLVSGLGGVAVLVASLWMLAAATLALKQALDYRSVYRALGVAVISWLVSALVQGLLYVTLFSVFGVSAT
jgi:hypothetical protein